MEEQELPVLGNTSNPKPSKISFVDLVQKTLNSGQKADALFFNQVLDEFKKDGTDVSMDFTPEMKEKIKETQGAEGLKQWEDLYDATTKVRQIKGDEEFYRPMVAPTWHNRAQGFTRFRNTEESFDDLQGEFAKGFSHDVRIKSQESIADNAPSIVDYDPLKGYFERKINGPEDIDSIVAMSGENKRLTIATNAVMAEVNPELKKLIVEGKVDPELPYKDENGQYRYRALKSGERPTSNIRSIWGPETYYHNSYFTEMLESLNDFAMDSLDAAAYIGQLPTNLLLNGSQKGFRAMGLEANWADAWNKNFDDYRNWSQSRRSTRSFEDAEGAFGDFTNFSKAMVQLVSQIAVTRGMGLLGGSAGVGLKSLGLGLSDDMIRGMMSNSAMGYGMMYASSAASEEARRNGLSPLEADTMALIAGAVIPLTEKLTGGQFVDKVFGPYRSKVFANKIIQEINEQAAKLGLKPSEIVADKQTFGAFLGNVSGRVNSWLSEPAETRLKNTIQGFVGEAFQESSEDGLNMLAQEFRDYLSGEDKYDNTWSKAFHELGQSFVLGGLGGAIGGAMFFDKKHWEMSYIDESKYDWITASVLKGEGEAVKKTLDKMHKEGKLGSTLYSAMQGEQATPMSLEKDPVAKSQNDLLYQQYKAQIELVEGIKSKFEKEFSGLAQIGEFIQQITGGTEFVENGAFASVIENSAHMMQREAIAMEIKTNHVKNMLALDLAKGEGNVDLSDVESIHAFNGKLISIQRKGKPQPEIPNIATKTAIEESLRQVYKNGDKIKEAGKTHLDYYEKEKLLSEAEYRLSKNPTNPEFIAAHKQALAEYEDSEKAFEEARKKANLSADSMDMLNAIKNLSTIREDLQKGERSKFYGHKAILEIAKNNFQSIFKIRPNMSVYDFRNKNKDRDYFRESIESENLSNQKYQELLVKFDALVTELSTLDGVALRSKIDEIFSLIKSTGKLYLSPALKSVLEAKVRELSDTNGLLATTDNTTMKIKAGELLTEGKIEAMMRRLLSLTALLDEKGKLKESFAGEIETIRENLATEISESGMDFENWDESADWKMLDIDTQSFMEEDSLEELIRFFEDNYDLIRSAIKQLEEAGFNFPGLNFSELLDTAERLKGPEFSDFLENRNQKTRLDFISKGEIPMEYLQSMAKDANTLMGDSGIDFSDFTDEDLQVLARAFNANGINKDNAGNSLIRKYHELHTEATDDKTKEDFTRIEELNQLRKELRENMLELVLENKINEWGSENGSEKFNKLFLLMKLMDSEIGKMISLAESNLNKRAGRDYKIKQGLINFETNALIALNDILGFLSPEDKDALEKLKVEPAREVSSDEDKKAVDDRLEKLIEFEEKASEVLKETLKEEGKAKEILGKLGLTVSEMFSFSSIGLVSGSVFRDLHEDSENPHQPKATHSQKEQLFNFLVQLERGNIRTFFNRMNEIIDKEKAQNKNFPSFEQALAARHLFGFIIAEQGSAFKGSINEDLEKEGKKLGSSKMTDSMIFVRGIAGAGKSSFVTNLAFELFSNELNRTGKTASALYSAPNDAQLENIGKSLQKISEGGFSSKPVTIEQLLTVGGKFDFSLLGDSRMVIIDEATLLDYNFMDLVNNIQKHNETASPENQVKLILIGDEFQNGPDSSAEEGKISFYRSMSLPIIERTVPLTTPYRSGKIESYNLQMTHRKIIAEINKIQRAKQYAEKGQLYTKFDGSKVKVDESNWRGLVLDVMSKFNSPKTFTHHEQAIGAIGFGVKVHDKIENVLKDFANSYAHAVKNNTEEDLVYIVQNEEDKERAVTELVNALNNIGVSVSADKMRTRIKSSREIQGLSIKHVFVGIDFQKALEENPSIEGLKTVIQAMYVAESREIDSLVLLHPGGHINTKVISKDTVFSYPQIKMDEEPDSEEVKKQKLDLIKENENLVDLIGKLARPEESAPLGKSEEVDSGTGVAGKKDSSGDPPPPAKPKTPRKKKVKPTKETKETHEENKDSDVLSKYMDNFEKNHDDIEKEIDEKGLTLEDILKKLEEEGDGACNI